MQAPERSDSQVCDWLGDGCDIVVGAPFTIESEFALERACD